MISLIVTFIIVLIALALLHPRVGAWLEAIDLRDDLGMTEE